ncbi:glycosyltransferase family 2 protein [Butyrivibrio sp. AE3009]|uniref:glycosyltransferase family 2 protein n=1 Tax=Butyrivibrio sp. AE3009 TaxID=1280666 RepID=UPI0003B6D62C|nr:glycosyltransferase family 2 protein [Butyrivibrio sp. AE3009]
MEDNLISVIIPVYNREKYLDRCICSVLAQKEVNTEIILIDDGSTDQSPEICDKYAKEHSNIKVIHNTNHGASYSRNCGLDVAKGNYIFFVDSDDIITEDALISLQTALVENDADYCIGNFDQYLEDGTCILENNIPPDFSNMIIDEKRAWDIMVDVNSFLIIVLWGKLFKREIWNNLRLPDMPISEDDNILSDILEKTNRIYILDKIIYHQTMSGESLIRSASAGKKLYSTNTIIKSIKYLISKSYYRVALFRFGDGTRRLLDNKRFLSIETEKHEFHRQYKEYCTLSKQLESHTGMKNRVRFMLFRFSIPLYNAARRVF